MKAFQYVLFGSLLCVLFLIWEYAEHIERSQYGAAQVANLLRHTQDKADELETVRGLWFWSPGGMVEAQGERGYVTQFTYLLPSGVCIEPNGNDAKVLFNPDRTVIGGPIELRVHPKNPFFDGEDTGYRVIVAGTTVEVQR